MLCLLLLALEASLHSWGVASTCSHAAITELSAFRLSCCDVAHLHSLAPGWITDHCRHLLPLPNASRLFLQARRLL